MENRYITVQYKLYAPMGEEKEIKLIEETRPEMPFEFISGLGMVLDSLEQQLLPLKKGEKFKITLTEDEAYGSYVPEGVQEIPLEAFLIDGKLDKEHIYEGAVVPLMNAENEHFNGVIAKINEKTVVVDLNHPLAGKSLTFDGEVVDNRTATDEEIKQYTQPHGCGGCGGHCGGSCGEGSCGSCGEGSCGSCGS